MTDQYVGLQAVEWPPPGTESLHGRLWRLRVRALLSFALILPAILWVLFPSPPARALTSVLLWAAGIGLFVFLSVITASAGLFDIARAAGRLGYSRSLLLEIALDHSTDTQSLVSGTGRYDIVRERTRSRVRSLRTFASVLLFSAAVLPLPLMCLALVLAFRASADPFAFALIPALPVVFLFVTAAVVNAYAAVLVHWDRGSDVWDPSPVSTAQRAAEWMGILRGGSDAGALDVDRVPPRNRSSGVLAGAATTLVAVALFVAAATVVVATVGTGTLMQYRQGGSVFLPTSRHAVEAEFVRYPAGSSGQLDLCARCR